MNNISTNTIKQIRADYVAGVPIREITAKYDISDGTVYRYLGNVKKRREIVKQDIKGKILDDYYKGTYTVRQISDKYDISLRTLYNILYRQADDENGDRKRSVCIRINMEEVKMLLTLTEGIPSFDRIRKRLTLILEGEDEGLVLLSRRTKGANR